MGSARGVICCGCVCLPNGWAELNQVNHILRTSNLSLQQSTHLNLLIFVFLYLQFCASIQQIINFPGVNFVVWHSKWKLPACFLKHDFHTLKQIFTHKLLNSLHRKSLSWPCLAVSKASDNTSVKQEINLRLYRAFIKTFCGLRLSKGIVHLKSLVLYILSNPIYSELALMHYNGWVAHTNNVYLAIGQFRSEQRSLSHTDVCLGPGSRVLVMVLHLNHSPFLPSNQHLEINITFDPVRFVEGRLFLSLKLYFLHSSPTFLSLICQLLNSASCWFLDQVVRWRLYVVKLLQSVSLLLIRSIDWQLLVFELNENLLVWHSVDGFFLLTDDLVWSLFASLH